MYGEADIRMTPRKYSAVLAVIGVVFFLLSGSAKERESLDGEMVAAVPLQRNREAEARNLGAGYVTNNFKPSLDMKEKVDFLLTPALLAQEAISGDTVLTYPEE